MNSNAFIIWGLFHCQVISLDDQPVCFGHWVGNWWPKTTHHFQVLCPLFTAPYNLDCWLWNVKELVTQTITTPHCLTDQPAKRASWWNFPWIYVESTNISASNPQEIVAANENTSTSIKLILRDHVSEDLSDVSLCSWDARYFLKSYIRYRKSLILISPFFL